jgi:hypothetical protein
MKPISVGRAARALIAGLVALCAAAPALAQTAAVARRPDTMPATPKFVVLPARNVEQRALTVGLPTWNFHWTHHRTGFTATFVGNAPTGAASTIPSFIIPIKFVVAGQAFTPTTLQSNGKSAVADTRISPIFATGIDFVQGGVDLGNTQYIDAYQRGDFWSSVQTNPGYHVLLGAPTVLPVQTITVPRRSGSVGVEFGVTVALVDINFVDAQLQAILTAHPEITAASLPVFLSYNTYLTQSGGCCIGGYHTANGSQTYMQFSYIGTSGAFAQDVSALSHEVGEWLLDPFTVNNSPCGVLENGDPLENEPNFGDYPYVLHGTFTYHLQDLVFMPYFGAPASTSVLNRSTFQGTALTVCQNGA